MSDHKIIEWLLRGDISIQYQVSRDLLCEGKSTVEKLQNRIAAQGWGKRFLAHQKSDGHWGITFYQPKWTSTHYTLLDLKTLGLHPGNPQAQQSVGMVLQQPAGTNGGVNLAVSLNKSDVCVNGMMLNYGSYFLPKNKRLKDIVDFLLQVQMPDGGWNCEYQRHGTTHSSLHSTLSVLEGLQQFKKSSEKYRSEEINAARKKAVSFLLLHHLFQSHRTGKTIDARFLCLSFPCRWRYDILRCLDYLQDTQITYDARMARALDILISKRDNKGRWRLEGKHKGAVHFDMEKTGTPSRWNTLRAFRVLKHFRPDIYRL